MLMWAEKIRPKNVDELVGQNIFTDDLRKWKNITDAPRAIILAGPSGTGKTSAAYVAAYELLGDSFNEHNFTITNGSDERGIDFIRNDLKNLMRIKPIDVERKIVVIDDIYTINYANYHKYTINFIFCRYIVAQNVFYYIDDIIDFIELCFIQKICKC